MSLPTLMMVGDEDDHCLRPSISLKKTLPAAGLLVLPKPGRILNLDELDTFNRFVAVFLAQVEAGQWPERDPRAIPAQIMKTA